MQAGTVITVDVEKPTAGGRMLARHDGQIVFVMGAIPGERVRARVTRTAKGVLYADAVEVLTASADRRSVEGDLRCGGNVFAGITPSRQVTLKGEILEDAFRRIARLPLRTIPYVTPSPEHGYRMRARLHVRDGRIGFLRESSHDLCDVGPTHQLLPETADWVASAASVLRRERLTGCQSIELAENVPATERVVHLELTSGERPGRYEALAAGLTGLSAQAADARDAVQLSGSPVVEDALAVSRGASSATLRLSRHVRAFFQGNRFLLADIVGHVSALVTDGPVVDLYAGVGLFGLALAALGQSHVKLVEGDMMSGASLVRNAASFGSRVQAQQMSVEQFLRFDDVVGRDETVVVDPPRTGLSPDAMTGLRRRRPPRLVYVSCDVATLARDTRALLESGYELASLRGFDLFPNTAHIESVASFHRP